MSGSAQAHRLGCAAWSTGDFDGALRRFLDVVREDPQDPAAWSNCGLALRDLDRLREAATCLRVATLLAPGFAPAWNEWANVLVDLGRLSEAERMYRHSLGLDASRAVVHHNLGHCLRLVGRIDEAVEWWLRALAIDPTYGHSLDELSALGRCDPVGADP